MNEDSAQQTPPVQGAQAMPSNPPSPLSTPDPYGTPAPVSASAPYSEPASAGTVPPPNYIGGSNVIDRSAVQAVYPTVGALPSSSSAGSQYGSASPYQEANSAFSEAKVLICGVASATSYILIIYLVKNLWATAIISVLLAAAAVYFAITEYRKTKSMGPMTVIGLSAATITIVYVLNILVAEAVIHSISSSTYGF